MFSANDTQQLTRASFEPIAVQRIRRGLPAIAAGLVLVLVGGSGLGYFEERFAAPVRMAQLGRENAALREEIDRAQMELAMERATRSELQRQLDAASERTAELTHQIEFMSSRGARARPAD